MDNSSLSKKAQKLVEQCKQYLDVDETPQQAILGTYETDWMGQKVIKNNGLFLATDKKLFFYAKRLTGYDSETFPYTKISSFESGKKLLGHYINFYTSGNKVSMKHIQDGNVGNFINYVKDKIEGHNKTENTSIPQSGNTVSSVDEIKNLAELRDAGILTEEEFSAKKRQILGL